ncbi:MAG TPA: PP0621 family protein [Burkholderiales bacterium]|nr:PP0621 family protein [Burkholderiales bacterium]
MSKFLFFVLIVGIVYWRLRYRVPAAPPASAARPIESMVRCMHCGIHLPRGEAVGSESAWYCSESHRRERRP